MKILPLVGVSLISVCISLNYPAHTKQIWLNCGVKQNPKNISYEQPFIVYLDSAKERFEVVEEEYEKIQGNATFFSTAIKFFYELPSLDLRIRKEWVIDRAKLNFAKTVTTVGHIKDLTSVYTGICQMLPPPPPKRNLI